MIILQFIHLNLTLKWTDCDNELIMKKRKCSIVQWFLTFLKFRERFWLYEKFAEHQN